MEDVKNGLLRAITARRSTRSYKQDTLPREMLDAVLEAGRMAPSGNNNQSTHFLVVTNPALLAELRGVVTGVLANTPIREGMPEPFVALIKNAKQGAVDVSYGAPALIITTNKKGYGNAIADCSCALQNMMLMAAACELGSCWINQFHLLREAPPLRAFMEKLGLREDEEVFGALSLGYTDKLLNTPLPRKGNPVTYN